MSIISHQKVCDPYNVLYGYDDWEPYHDFGHGGGGVFDHHLHRHNLLAAPHATAFSHGAPASAGFVSAKIEWEETPEAHVVKAEVPGLKREEVKVELEEGGTQLCISGERKVEKEEKAGNCYRVERSSGRFVQRFRLPEKAKADKIKAHMENGIIKITIPKREIKKASSKTIPIC